MCVPSIEAGSVKTERVSNEWVIISQRRRKCTSSTNCCIYTKFEKKNPQIAQETPEHILCWLIYDSVRRKVITHLFVIACRVLWNILNGFRNIINEKDKYMLKIKINKKTSLVYWILTSILTNQKKKNRVISYRFVLFFYFVVENVLE